MDKLQAVIIEDEQASRTTLKNYLEKYCPNVELLGEAENVNQGFELINSTDPELVFLDIEMPFGNAFDLLEKFKSIEFEIIFITAFSEYALKALNLSASSYLLKPLNIDQLISSVTQAAQSARNKKRIHSSNILLENLTIENQQLKKIALPLIDGFEVVTLKEIVQCNAYDNFTQIFLSNGSKKTVCRTLKFYEELLSDYNFLRVHKSYMINLNWVKQYKKGKTGEIILSNGNYIPLSASRKKTFLEKFNQL